MTPLLAGKDAGAETARAGEYARHRPEQTRQTNDLIDALNGPYSQRAARRPFSFAEARFAQ